jgi:hypothetical protein
MRLLQQSCATVSSAFTGVSRHPDGNCRGGVAGGSLHHHVPRATHAVKQRACARAASVATRRVYRPSA